MNWRWAWRVLRNGLPDVEVRPAASGPLTYDLAVTYAGRCVGVGFIDELYAVNGTFHVLVPLELSKESILAAAEALRNGATAGVLEQRRRILDVYDVSTASVPGKI